MKNEAAICVRNANKSYGKKEILKNLCMTVPKGSIYGLLGASGCGKTTLLSCVVGRKTLNSGEVYVLGGKPGTVGSGVPGARIGYMPQEIALVGEFTVKDAVFYFGRLLNMEESLIETRFKHFSELLELPPDDRFLKNCSGGQQRRISFAAAMVHMPELLILDEPTAGVDPLLRDRIWSYLSEVTQKERIAVIITTHYIEETRQANLIGLMREGRLLAEESPNTLLSLFNTDSLENVFLILSQKQEAGTLDELENPSDKNLDLSIQSPSDNHETVSISTKPNKIKKVSGMAINKNRVKALMDKNWKQFYRNISGIMFLLLFPILETGAFLLAIGGDIKNIKVAVVNDENINNGCSNYTYNQTAVPYGYLNCNLTYLSCRFLSYLDDPMLDIVYVDSLPEALDGIYHGKYVGAMYMAENFTDSLEARFNEGKDVDDEILPYSEIQTHMDMSNRQVGMTVKYKLLNLYLDYHKAIFEDCKFDPKLANLPLNFFDPVYGKEDDNFTVFMVPGVLVTIIFFLSTMMTSQIIIADRCEGVWDRSAVAGVTALEITLTHFLMQICIVVVQVFEVFALIFWWYNIQSMGSLWSVFLICVLQGMCGMCFGFWISIISHNYSMANIVATGLFYPMIVTCGIVWPLEGMPWLLAWISKCSPYTMAVLSIRNILQKGWGLDSFYVLNGIGIELIWIVSLSLICILMIKRKQ